MAPPKAQSTKIILPVRLGQSGHLSEFAKSLKGIQNFEDTLSIYKQLVPMKQRTIPLNIDTGRLLISWESGNEPNTGFLTYEDVNTKQRHRVPAFQKSIALIDSYEWMKDKERPTQPFIWAFQKGDILDPVNQAYVDAVASSLASELAKKLKSEHFCECYGAGRGVAEKFRYNMEDDLEEFRFTKWFWAAIDADEFKFIMREKKTGRVLSNDEIKELIRPDDEYLGDDTDSEESESTDGENSSETSSLSFHEINPDEAFTAANVVGGLEEINDLNELETLSENEAIILNPNSARKSVVTLSTTTSNESNDSITDDYDVFVEFTDMPVVLLYLERMEDTMDSLLTAPEFAPAKTSDLEKRWTAWVFQVVIACAQLQGTLGLTLTHNDLHTNNVLFKKTEREYLWYKDSKGRVWRVPTYGYIFTIIDYGRAIFIQNGFTVVSSEYNDGHNAAGMYNFGPIQDTDLPIVPPNKSFDLSRLACSLLRALYPVNPPSKPKGMRLTKEGEWEIRETEHPLFNLLWTWLRTKNGNSILENEHGQEKYPGFDLYTIIAAEVRDAVPAQQFGKDIFKEFIATAVPGGVVATYIPL